MIARPPRWFLIMIFSMTALCATAARAETEVDVIKDAITALQGINGTLDAVKDADSAKAAAPKIDDEANAIAKLADRKRASTPVTGDDAKQAKDTYGPQLQAVNASLFANAKRIGESPDLATPLEAPVAHLKAEIATLSIAMPGHPAATAATAPADHYAGGLTFEQRVEKLKAQQGEDKVVLIVFEHVPKNLRRSPLAITIRKLVGKKNWVYYKMDGDTFTVAAAPVEDIDAFNKSLDFGKATVDATAHTITIQTDAEKLPKSAPKN